MKRDFLKSLGIEDKETIDKILDENSTDIGRAKGELETLKEKVTTLEGQIKTKDGEIATLKEKADSVDGLNEKIKTLTADNQKLNGDLTTKVNQIKRDHAIEGGVRDRGAKNVKAVMALLDMSKITYENDALGGLDDQLEALQKGEDTSFLFQTSTTPTPAGTKPNTPPASGGNNPPTATTFRDAVAKALTKSN